MHKLDIRRGFRLLLVAGLCFGTLAATGAVGQEEESARPPAAPVTEAAGQNGTHSPEEEAAKAEKEAAARQERAAALLSGIELSGQQRESLAKRMGGDEPLLRRLEQGELTREDLICLALPNGRSDRLGRYGAWAADHPEDPAETVVLQVNTDRDQEFYSLIRETADPAGLTALVNKYYTLPADYVPELEALGKGYGSGSLCPEAAAAFRAMADGAKADGVSLRSVSAYRSYKTQKNTYSRYLRLYKQATVDTFSARPGHSEHQTGLALDINVASTSAHFENTPAFAWLKEHCAEYGFILRYDQGKEAVTGYRFEPWHYRYVGVEIAKACMEQGLAYEEYLASRPVW